MQSNSPVRSVCESPQIEHFRILPFCFFGLAHKAGIVASGLLYSPRAKAKKSAILGAAVSINERNVNARVVMPIGEGSSRWMAFFEVGTPSKRKMYRSTASSFNCPWRWMLNFHSSVPLGCETFTSHFQRRSTRRSNGQGWGMFITFRPWRLSATWIFLSADSPKECEELMDASFQTLQSAVKLILHSPAQL